MMLTFNPVPAFCFCGLARSLNRSGAGRDLPALADARYKDGQAGGYSIVACVVSKPLLLLEPGRVEVEPLAGSENVVPDAMNLRAIMEPLDIDTRSGMFSLSLSLSPLK